MLQAFNNIQKYIPKKSTLIIGLSGGPDSVCLLNLLVQQRDALELTLIAAHLDHQWRINSANDVEFCKELCKKFKVTLVTKTINDLALHHKPNGSQEETGRIYRNYFFNDLKQEYNADFIALGHHADDQLETFFIRLMRGTTPSGLQCMRIMQNTIFRPLLTTTKQEIINYLETQHLQWLFDETNNSDKYLRNRIRHTALPALITCDTRAPKNILHTIQAIQESEEFLETLTQNNLNSLLINDNNTSSLDIKKFEQLEQFMQYRVLSLWLCTHASAFTLSRAFLDEILRFLLNKKGGTHQVNTTFKITKKLNQATIYRAG